MLNISTLIGGVVYAPTPHFTINNTGSIARIDLRGMKQAYTLNNDNVCKT